MENKKIIVLKGLEGNQPTHLTALQQKMKPYLPEMLVFWWVVFWGVVVVLIWKLWKSYQEQKNENEL